MRALYAAERNGAGNPVKLQRIHDLARELILALKLAEAGTDTVGGRAAWVRAERVVAQLPDVVEIATPLEPVMKAAAKRVRRR